jgi:Ankyrin repeats (3 copies)/mTERF
MHRQHGDHGRPLAPLLFCCIAPILLLVNGFELPIPSHRAKRASTSFVSGNHHDHRSKDLAAVVVARDTTNTAVASTVAATTTAATTTTNGGETTITNNNNNHVPHIKRLPSLQQVAASRPARRMNNGFRHLFRHAVVMLDDAVGRSGPMDHRKADAGGSTSSSALTSTDDPMTYLMTAGNFTRAQVVQMNHSFPMLLQLSVPRQLYPKMMFLQHTLRVADPASIFDQLPPPYFGARLERTLAPRHAFLVWMGLPSGPELFRAHRTGSSSARTSSSRRNGTLTTTTTLFGEFMKAGRNTNQFAALCQTWRRSYQASDSSDDEQQQKQWCGPIAGPVTALHIEAFDLLFSRGLLAAARNFELGQTKWAADLWPTLSPANVTRLLIQHGANPKERDHRGATLLHWACGSGNWDVATELLPYCSVWDDQSRDSSTPLHWAAAGTTAREFGVGGHPPACQELLTLAAQSGPGSVPDYVNRVTKDGNSALMWAAWSGTLETVKLLARHRADATIANRNGCTVAHWATSGGNLEGMLFLLLLLLFLCWQTCDCDPIWLIVCMI